MKPPSQDILFWSLLALTALAGLAVLWLVARSGKPFIPNPVAPDWSASFGRVLNLGPVSKLVEAVRYLLTSREARYARPWVLIIGEKGAGKSSLARSCAAQLQDPVVDGKESIQLPGAQFLSFGRGDLIDPDGRLGSAKDERNWKELFDAIDHLRPERPIDKIVLVLNARTLIRGDEDALQSSAREALLQLESVQERFEFALPVYLLITNCDAVTGFAAFWNSQRSAVRRQICGWTAPPNLQSQPPEKWVETVFATMIERLRQLLFDAAAASENIEEMDQVFLFPVGFRRLAAPLARWFEVVFQPSRWSQGFFCRGIYFTGSVEADGALEDGQRQDIAFIRDLFRERVFAEPHLAAATRRSIWSRNQLIRRVQYSALAAGVGLFLALGVSARHLSQQVSALDSVLSSLHQYSAQPAAGVCQDAASVVALLRQIDRLDARLDYPAIPLSWIDNRDEQKSASEISETSFKEVIMPAMACRIRQKADALMAPSKETRAGGDPLAPLKQRFFGYLGAVRELEVNLARFSKISRSASRTEEQSLLRDFGDLYAYAFEQPLPEDLSHARRTLRASLVHFSYDKPIELPAGARTTYARQIRDMSEKLRSAFDRELYSGSSLLGGINRWGKSESTVEDDTSHLLWWLNWVRQSWLGATESHNPCEEVRQAAAPWLFELNSNFEYRKELGQVADSFGPRSCFRPSIRTLGGLTVAPYGNMFFSDSGFLELNPELASEFSGLGAVMDMRYMHLTPRPGFVCQNDLAGFDPSLLAEASRYAREFLNFVKGRKLPASGEDDNLSLYLRLARRQLEANMMGAVNAAQIPTTASQALAGVNGLSGAERELMDESGKFHAAAPQLLEALDLYGQTGFSSRAREIAQCTREFAVDSLRRIYSLADDSRLYDPGTVDSLFPLPGDLAVTRDWLDRQAARIKVLSGYASQYVFFLKNSQGLDEHLWSDDQDAAFWDNTIAELERYQQFKEPNGQVAHLDDLFVKTLAGMNAANCRERLSSYNPPDYGNDLFSRLRRQRLNQAQAQCDERHDAPALAAYQILADRFNRELSGRYPFAASGKRDASPAAVKAFLSDYAARKEELRSLAEGPARGRLSQVRRFIEQLDSVAAFFAGNLSQAPASGPLHVAVYFNTLPANSPGANQVLSWTLASGGAEVSNRDGAPVLEWGWKPIELGLAWASGSLWRPLSVGAQPDMAVEDAAVAIKQGGPWALLRLIQAHRMNPAPAADPASPDLIELEFAVPVGSQGSSFVPARAAVARLHVGLELSDGKSASPLSIPQFPFAAPAAFKE